MNNREFYKETMDEVHIPEAVLGKVRNMKMEQKMIKKRETLRYAVSVLSVLAICFAASNGICYAVTGNTWVGKITMYVNGEKVEKDITLYKDENGDVIHGEIEAEEGADSLEVILPEGASEAAYDEADNSISFGNSNTGKEYHLISEEGKNYLVIGDNLLKIDITEDFADGKCSGSFELEGVKYQYEITGDMEEYDIDIQS